MDGLPENIVHIDVLRINRGIEKRCKCKDKTFIVDTQNRCVNCGSCGALIDPYEAIEYLATYWERVEQQTEALLEQRRQIANYKPHLVVMRELERRYRGKKMLPCCPHCGRGFYFEEIKSWVGRGYEEHRRFMEKEGGA
jgi:predicted molibdopterin-dependent oxidoreductase YjgC